MCARPEAARSLRRSLYRSHQPALPGCSILRDCTYFLVECVCVAGARCGRTQEKYDDDDDGYILYMLQVCICERVYVQLRYVVCFCMYEERTFL